MRVTRRRARLSMSEHLPDNQQRRSGGGQDGGVGMAKVVDTDALDLRCLADRLPEGLDFLEGLVPLAAGEDIVAPSRPPEFW